MPDPLAGVSAAQRRAVVHPGETLVIAGRPGTGKTHVVTRRVVWLIEQGADAESVIALTPSRAAAERMRCRAEALVERPYGELRVHAFEDLCRRVLHEEALEAGVDPF